MRPRLTALIIKQAKPRQAPYEIRCGKLTGFLLRVQPSGYKSLSFEYWRGDKKRRIKLGNAEVLPYPDAIAKATELAAQVAQGLDPAGRKEEIDARKYEVATLDDFLTDTYEPWLKANRKSAAAMVRRIRTGFAELLPMALDALTPLVIEQAASKTGPLGGKLTRELAYLKAAMAKAAEWNIIATDPAKGIKLAKSDKGIKRRALTDTEVE
jgi:hypothetical protein